ncbi:MAG: prenyltransferase/squalene oxidase repeat-containing protein [Planctomycetales bacterium]
MLLIACFFAPVSAAPKVPRSVETSGLDLINAETDQAILRGLRYLAAQQHADGSFGDSVAVRSNVAIVSLAGMAFLSAGHTPGRGEFGETVEKATQFILKACQPNGFIHLADSIGHGPMYGHGFATLYLAEVYGMSPRQEIHDKLQRAVKIIISSQNKEGGWRYYPVKNDADISVTVCQMMALRAARNAGIAVPKETVDSCLEYVKKCQNLDGGFKYQLIQGSESLFPRSAAGLVALYSAGLYEGKNVERALGYVQRYHPGKNQGVHRNEPHFFYGHYYAVQGMWLAGGDSWQQWYPAIQKELLSQQMSDGSWGDHFSPEYGTAMACIILQMPNCYLPIFQR